MSIKITEDQHYVPRSYLKNFATVIGSGKKERALVSFYQFDKSLLIEDIPTKSICYKSYFYGEDGEIEKDFSEKESKWAKVLKDIIGMKSYDLTFEQEQLIKEFSVYQFCRTVASHNFVKSSAKELLTAHVTSQYHFAPDDEIICRMVEKKVDEDIKPTLLIESCQELVTAIDDLQITVIHFNTAERLITSDMPVLILNPFSVRGVGMSTIGIFIIIPVSPHVAVGIYDKKVYQKCYPYMETSNETDVINLNKYQIISAEERIISQFGRELEKSICYNDVLTQREQFQALRKVDSSYDGFSTFFAIHTRSIPYIFDLSFCALPKPIKKVPKECRDLYPREYQEGYWHKLLINEYRLPELLLKEQKFDVQTVKQHKKGYSVLRAYLEDYWEIPVTERTITPMMMQQIKTSRATFFPISNNK